MLFSSVSRPERTAIRDSRSRVRAVSSRRPPTVTSLCRSIASRWFPTAPEIQISLGRSLTPHPGACATATKAVRGEILTGAETFRFDGSDPMPGETGTSAFWQGMAAYRTGASGGDVAAGIRRRWSRIE